MYLLDTDSCIYWLRGHTHIRERFSQLDPPSLAISIITLAELRYGADCSSRPIHNHAIIDDFLSAISVLGIDHEIASEFGRIKAILRRKGSLIEDFDLLIGATARVHDLTLITGNIPHFERLPGLKIEDWT